MSIRNSIRTVSASLLLLTVSPLAAQGTVAQPSPEATPPVIPAEPVIPEGPSATPPATIAPPPVVTPPPAKTPPAKSKGATDGLRPGQYVFEKHDSYDGALRIVAVLDIQRLYVFMDDKLIAFTTISSGKKGKATPTGIFSILEKDVDHKSNIYSAAPMPFMQRLTWDGIAMHAGQIPGYAASHGCIRLPMAFARQLYGITKSGQEVVVLSDFNQKLKKPEPPKPVEPAVIETPPPAVPVVTTAAR